MHFRLKLVVLTPIVRPTIILIMGVLLQLFAYQARAEKPLYSVGIVPQQPSIKLARKWMPLLKRLEEQSNIKLRFKTAPSIGEFEKQLQQGKYDFAYANPLQYVLAEELQKYYAVAKAKNSKLQGILVVRKDSPIKSIRDLENKTVAFPSPVAFAATMLVQVEFKEAGINVYPEYVQSHDSVYRNVAEGRSLAGGGIKRTLANIESNLADELIILAESKAFTPHPFIAHPRVPKEHVTKVISAMLALQNSEVGRKLLESINFNGIEAANPEQWEDIRSMRSLFSPNTPPKVNNVISFKNDTRHRRDRSYLLKCANYEHRLFYENEQRKGDR